MNGSDPRFWKLFFEVYEALPRQGPGSRACAAKALGYCRNLPEKPAILDLGCGVGGQTLHLAELTGGMITAIDSHAPSIARLEKALAESGLSKRIKPLVGNMARPDLPSESYDLIWSEGALYNIGIRNALQICHALLKPEGYLAFTNAVWRRENPPPEIKAGFDMDYPDMGCVEDIEKIISESGFRQIGRFLLPDEAWWDDFYTPMEQQINVLRGKYRHDKEALHILDQLALEPVLHRRYSDYYAYVFFVLQCR